MPPQSPIARRDQVGDHHRRIVRASRVLARRRPVVAFLPLGLSPSLRLHRRPADHGSSSCPRGDSNDAIVRELIVHDRGNGLVHGGANRMREVWRVAGRAARGALARHDRRHALGAPRVAPARGLRARGVELRLCLSELLLQLDDPYARRGARLRHRDGRVRARTAPTILSRRAVSAPAASTPPRACSRGPRPAPRRRHHPRHEQRQRVGRSLAMVDSSSALARFTTRSQSAITP